MTITTRKPSVAAKRAAAPKKADPVDAALAKRAGKTKVPDDSTGSATRPLPKGFKFPKTLAACADLYWETREKRLAAEKEIEAGKAVEAAMRDHLIATLPTQQASTIGGKLCKVTLVRKSVPKVTDWSLVYKKIVDDYQAHAKRRDGLQDSAFALVGKSIGRAAVQEAWDAGKQVPGVEAYPVVELSVSKL